MKKTNVITDPPNVCQNKKRGKYEKNHNDFYLIYSVYRVLFRCGFVQVKPGYGDYEYCQRTGCSFTTKTDVKATASEHYIVNGGYILFSSDLTDNRKIVFGQWKTYETDVSSFGSSCTEFSIILAKGNIMYLRNVVIE